jgi:hypothetical protein
VFIGLITVNGLGRIYKKLILPLFVLRKLFEKGIKRLVQNKGPGGDHDGSKIDTRA